MDGEDLDSILKTKTGDEHLNFNTVDKLTANDVEGRDSQKLSIDGKPTLAATSHASNKGDSSALPGLEGNRGSAHMGMFEDIDIIAGPNLGP